MTRGMHHQEMPRANVFVVWVVLIGTSGGALWKRTMGGGETIGAAPALDNFILVERILKNTQA